MNLESLEASAPLTLKEYQQSTGIPLEQQIILLNNPLIYKGLQSCFYPWRKTRSPLRYLQESLTQKSIYRLKRGKLALGLNSPSLFAGYFDFSFNDLNLLDPVFNFIGKRKSVNFKVLVGKGDYVVDESLVSRLPSNLTQVIANNVNIADERIRYLPMGRDFRSISLFKDLRPSVEKTHLCYCNFSTNTHPIREKVAEQLRGKPFIKMEEQATFLKYPLSREKFFDILRKSKFCVCPRGNAFDTFRLWDCLYVGTIPIVVKEAVFHGELEDLPILFLDSYDQFHELDESFLERKYQEMQTKLFRYQKLTANFWLGQSNK